jgi:hypothetical protein
VTKRKLSVRVLAVRASLLSILLIFSAPLLIDNVYAKTWMQLDDPPPENSGDATTTMLVYGRNGVTRPYYSIWNSSVWSDELMEGTMDSQIRWVVTRTAPTRFEIVTGVLTYPGDQGDLYANVWNGSWGTVQPITFDIGAARTAYRGFDIAYEQNSGDALIVYHRWQNGIIYYRIWDGTAWSTEQSYTLSTLEGIPLWISAASKPNSNEIAILVADNQRDAAGIIWNGNSMGNEQLLEKSLSQKRRQCHDVAYEQASGRAMFVWASDNEMQSRLWTGSSWTSELSPVSIGAIPYWFSLKDDPNSNKLILVSVDDANCLNTVRWSGSAWTKDSIHDSDIETYLCRCADSIFEDTLGHSGHIILVWGKNDTDIARYRHFDGSTWSSTQSIESTTHSTDPQVVQLRRDDDGLIFLAILDDGKDLNGWTWDSDASTWTWRKEHWNNLPYAKFEPFMVTRSPSVNNPVDKVDLYCCNDGVYVYFKETLTYAPDPASFTYAVYLDKPAGGTYSKDFRIVYSSILKLMTSDDEVDPADDVSNDRVDIHEGYVTSSQNCIIFKITVFSSVYDGEDYYYRVFIDSDQNKNTGYRDYINGHRLAIGAEYYIEYNYEYAGLYRFTGATQTSWRWSFIGDTDDRRVLYEKSGGILKLRIYRSDIGNPSAFDLVYNTEKIDTNNIDWAPDSYNDTSYYATYTVRSAWGEFHRWNGIGWDYVEDINVTTGAFPYSITFKVPLESIGNPEVQQDTNVCFVEYYGADYGTVYPEMVNPLVIDEACGFISAPDVPGQPWPTPLIFVPAVVAALYFVYKRRCKWIG